MPQLKIFSLEYEKKSFSTCWMPHFTLDDWKELACGVYYFSKKK
ncbi:MAG: hypothetical protein SNJ71_01755 [Bacteroidales bacterium]